MKLINYAFLWLQVLVAAICGAHGLYSADWPMFGHDPQRTGWASEETTLTSKNVSLLELKWKVRLKNEAKFLNALTAPIVAADVETAQGKKTLVYVAGTSNNFYALEAATGSVYWSRNFPTRLHPGDTPHVETIFCPDAITATPAIDRKTSTVYVIAMDGWLYGLDLATGKDKFQPMPFVAPFSKDLSLNVVDGVVYTTLSQGCGDGPSGFYSMDIKNPRHPVIRDLLTSASETGGIWGRGGPVAGKNGRIYGMTADGRVNPSIGDFGSSVVAASMPDLNLADYFTPKNWREINRLDLDLASGSPVWFTWGKYQLLAGGGKEGVLYLMDANCLGGDDHHTPLFVSPPLANDKQSFQMRGIWGSPAVWKDASAQTWLYVPIWGPVSKHAPKFPITNGPNPHGCIMAFKVEMNASSPMPTLRPVWVSRDFNLPDPPIIANGVVLALSTGENAHQRVADRSRDTRPAVLYALDAKTGAVLFDSGEQIRSWVHFSGLAAADGQVYVVDHDSWVYCFGLSHGARRSFRKREDERRFSTTVSGAKVVGRSESVEPPSLPPPAERRVVFRRDIKPILREYCVSCHGPDKQMGGLRLDSRAGALKGGTRGPAIKPGNSAESKLIWAVSGTHNIPLMPFGGRKLTPEEISILRAWIDQGAVWPPSVGRLTPRSTDSN